MSEPAALSAAARPPTAKAKAPPISISLSTSQVMSMTSVRQHDALGDDGREPDGQRHGDDPAHAQRDQLGAEHRREDEERADAGQHEDERGHVLLAEARDELAGGHPTRVGIRDQRSVV